MWSFEDSARLAASSITAKCRPASDMLASAGAGPNTLDDNDQASIDEVAASYVPVQTSVWMPVDCNGRPPRRGEFIVVTGQSTTCAVGGRFVHSIEAAAMDVPADRVLTLPHRPLGHDEEVHNSVNPERLVLGIATGAFETVPGVKGLVYLQSVVAGSAYVQVDLPSESAPYNIGKNMKVLRQVDHRVAVLTMSRSP